MMFAACASSQSWDSGGYQFTSSSSYSITVSVTGIGSGSLAGSTNCSIGTNSFSSGTPIVCIATPNPGSTASISGTGSASPCSGTSCSFPLGSTTAVTVTFNLVGTSTCGLTTQSSTDSGNASYAFGTPCVPAANSTVSAIYYWVGNPVSTSFGLGVYSTSASLPSALLCSVNTGTITPSSGWNSISISSCPTLVAGTTYWVGYATASNSIQQGIVAGNCPGTSSNTLFNDSISGSTLPNPFGTTQPPDGYCYSFYLTLTAASPSKLSAPVALTIASP